MGALEMRMGRGRSDAVSAVSRVFMVVFESKGGVFGSL